VVGTYSNVKEVEERSPLRVVGVVGSYNMLKVVEERSP